MLFLSAVLNDAEENCVNTVSQLTQQLKLPITTSTIKKQLREHPDYPSLLSVSDSLNKWKIENISAKITADKLKEMPVPFITQIQERSNTFFVVVKSMTGNTITISDTTATKWSTLPLTEFENKWTGIVTLVDASADAGEKEYHKNRGIQTAKKGLRIFTAAVLLFVWAFWIYQDFSYQGTAAIASSILFTLKFAGCYIGGLLLWYEIDQHNPSLQSVCKAGIKTNCNAILKSKASSIGGIIKWSEVGFLYFATGFIMLLAGGPTRSVLSLITWMNLLALPYTVYSVYYQWRVAKQWCLLCLTVQALLLAEFLAAAVGGFLTAQTLSSIDSRVLPLAAISSLLPVIGWFLLKPQLLLAKESAITKLKLARLKQNPQIFEALLTKQKDISGTDTQLGITLGNPHATNKIVKVCNPYCGPCAQAHPEIEELLQQNEDLQVQMIFTATDHENDTKAPPVKHFLALAEKQDPQLLHDALNDWYNATEKDYEAFAKKYKLNGELQHQGDKLKAMREWCDRTSISFTPTFFINGHQLPEMYSVKDLQYFLNR